MAPWYCPAVHRGYQPSWPATLCRVFDEFDDALSGGAPPLELAQEPVRPQRKRRTSQPTRKVDIRARARAMANLPEAPESPFACIGYGLTVRKRLGELRAKHEAAQKAYDEARAHAVRSRVELGAAIHRVGSPELGELVAGVDGAAHTAEERQAQLAELREKTAEARARHKEELSQLEKELKPWHARRGRAQAEVDLARKELARAKEALDRVSAEMEPLAGDPASLAPFKEAYDARRAEATEHRTALAEHEATLAAASAKVDDLETQMAQVRATQQAKERQLQDAENAAEAAADDAGASREEALLTLARAALERGLVPDDLPEGPVADRATEAEAAKALDLQIHTAALTVHDEEALARGATAAGMVTALVAVAVLVVLVL